MKKIDDPTPPEWLEVAIAEAEDFDKTSPPPWWLCLMFAAAVITLLWVFISSLQVGDETAAAIVVLTAVGALIWVRFI